MKLIKLFLVAIVFIVNVAIARPALADPPPIDQNPDYVAITEELSNLTQARDTETPPEGMTLADVQRQINGLQYQKYIMETGKDTICRNDTTQTVAIYGERPKKSTATFDQVMYLLPPGEETDDDFACKGVYLPNDVKVAGLKVGSAAAIKILDGTQLVLTEDPDTGAIALNLPPAHVFKAGDVNWEIPDLTQAQLTTQFPTAPLD
jgi:hypothetical protein